MSWSVRDGGSDLDDGNTFTTEAGDTVLVAMIGWTSGSPSGATFNGVAMTLVGSIAVGSVAAGIWYLNNPPIGAYVLELVGAVASGQGVYYIVGTIGETAAVRDFQTVSHASNDIITTPTITSNNADLAFYAGTHGCCAPSYTGVDNELAVQNNTRGAREAGNGAGVVASFGSGGNDDNTCLIGVSLQVKMISRMAGIIVV